MKHYVVTAAQGKISRPIMSIRSKNSIPVIVARRKLSMPIMAGQGASVFASV